jgi:hypothetical protein
MATWTNVPNTVLEPGDPIRSVDIIAIKENVIALSEGASGAPPIQTAALATGERMNTTNVLNATAGATFGAVGTYALLGETTFTATSIGNTRAGSALRPFGFVRGSTSFGNATEGNLNAFGSTTVPSGTWRALGPVTFRNVPAYGSFAYGGCLWLRIS